jgi:hypothetical protein
MWGGTVSRRGGRPCTLFRCVAALLDDPAPSVQSPFLEDLIQAIPIRVSSAAVTGGTVTAAFRAHRTRSLPILSPE